MACRCSCEKDLQKIKFADEALEKWGREDPRTPGICLQCAIFIDPEDFAETFHVSLDDLDLELSCESCHGCPGYKETNVCIRCKRVLNK